MAEKLAKLSLSARRDLALKEAPEGLSLMEGSDAFADGVPQGECTVHFPDGSKCALPPSPLLPRLTVGNRSLRARYVGQLVDGVISGHGVYESCTGTVFKGHFVSGSAEAVRAPFPSALRVTRHPAQRAAWAGHHARGRRADRGRPLGGGDAFGVRGPGPGVERGWTSRRRWWCAGNMLRVPPQRGRVRGRVPVRTAQRARHSEESERRLGHGLLDGRTAASPSRSACPPPPCLPLPLIYPPRPPFRVPGPRRRPLRQCARQGERRSSLDTATHDSLGSWPRLAMQEDGVSNRRRLVSDYGYVGRWVNGKPRGRGAHFSRYPDGSVSYAFATQYGGQYPRLDKVEEEEQRLWRRTRRFARALPSRGGGLRGSGTGVCLTPERATPSRSRLHPWAEPG